MATFTAGISDTSGVASASVSWSATYLTTTYTGSDMMTNVLTTTWSVNTQVSIPTGGLLTWTVVATDTVGNVSAPVTGSPNLDDAGFTGVCQPPV